jgi:hypothetical protein
MKPTHVLVAALAAAGLGACASAPPPIDYGALLMAPCANPADATPWLTIAVWDDGDKYDMGTRFQAGGVMPYVYEHEPDATFDNGRWSVEGQTLRFDMNDHYADYEGVFDGRTATGTMKNVEDHTGKWTMSRACND